MPLQFQPLVKAHETAGASGAAASQNAADVVKRREMSVPRTKSDGTDAPPGAAKPLSPRQRAAAMMLVAGKTVNAVALELGIDQRTISRWKKLPGFNDEIERCLLQLRTATNFAAASNPAALRMHRRPSPPAKPKPIEFDWDDDEDDDDEAPVPTETEKQDMEKLFASIGYTPTWKRGIGQCPEMSGNVRKCPEMSGRGRKRAEQNSDRLRTSDDRGRESPTVIWIDE